MFGHWPLETSLTAAALLEVQIAVEHHLTVNGCEGVEIELHNLAANIRAYLQCVAAGMPAYRDEPTDEELLA